MPDHLQGVWKTAQQHIEVDHQKRRPASQHPLGRGRSLENGVLGIVVLRHFWATLELAAGDMPDEDEAKAAAEVEVEGT